MMTQEKIGKFIAKMRKEKDLTQEQFAEKLGVSNRSISRWENGKTLPDISLFPSICEELGINITELLNGKRTDKEADLKELFGLLIDFFDQENKRIIRFVNRYYIFGFICLILVLLHSQFKIFAFAKTVEFLIGTLVGLGIVSAAAGFYYSKKRKIYTENEIAAFLGLETKPNLHTAGEMLQYAKRYQKAELKQYEKAFQAIEKELLPDENVSFTMVADTFVVNESWTDSWKPWHIGMAVSDHRIMVCGEAIHGRFMTFYDVESFEVKDVASVELINQKIVIKFSNETLHIEGKNLEAVIERLKNELL